MYALLSSASQAAISQEDFVKYYNDAAIQSTLTDLEIELINKSSSHQEAEYRLPREYAHFLDWGHRPRDKDEARTGRRSMEDPVGTRNDPA